METVHIDREDALELIGAAAKKPKKSEEIYYFAYGSNLNKKDLKKWCSVNGYDYPLIEVGKGVLDGYYLVFNYKSKARNGGVLSIKKGIGSKVVGMVYSVSDIRVLDAKEGHPNVYKRMKVKIKVGRSTIEAITYKVLPAKDQGFVPPNPAYLKVVKDGLQAHGLPVTMLNQAAKDYQ